MTDVTALKEPDVVRISAMETGGSARSLDDEMDAVCGGGVGAMSCAAVAQRRCVRKTTIRPRPWGSVASTSEPAWLCLLPPWPCSPLRPASAETKVAMSGCGSAVSESYTEVAAP